MAELIHKLDTKSITLRIKLPRLFGFRMWLTKVLLCAAGTVCPATIEVDLAD